MDWRDIAAIVFICTTVNHLGLIKAIEERTGRELPVINCPKCFTFWSVLVCGMADSSLFTLHSSLTLLAISLLCSYIALWLELFMYAIDTLYNRIYGKIENNDRKEDEGRSR
jgi:hypothetical protein